MPQITGFYLDDKNIITPGVGMDGKTTWWLMTFTKDIVDGIIEVDYEGEKFFDMKEIDPNNFEWTGQKLKIDFGGTDEKKDSKTLAQRNTKKRRKTK